MTAKAALRRSSVLYRRAEGPSRQPVVSMPTKPERHRHAQHRDVVRQVADTHIEPTTPYGTAREAALFSRIQLLRGNRHRTFGPETVTVDQVKMEASC